MPPSPTEHRPHQAAAPTGQRPHHAVVIGAGVGGLAAAQALSHHFERVTLVERDDVPEWVTRRLVMDTPQIIVRSGLEVTGLVVAERTMPGTGGRVRAVDVRPRGAVTAEPTECIVAELVVDASGSGSRASEWLATAGCESPGMPDGFVIVEEQG